VLVSTSAPLPPRWPESDLSPPAWSAMAPFSHPPLSFKRTAPPATLVTSTRSAWRLRVPPVAPEPITVLPIAIDWVVAPVELFLQISVPGWPTPAVPSAQIWAARPGSDRDAPAPAARRLAPIHVVNARRL